MSKPLPPLAGIHTSAFDFDGVFTDNNVWVDQDGREMVRCDRGDGLAFDLVRAFQRRGRFNAVAGRRLITGDMLTSRSGRRAETPLIGIIARPIYAGLVLDEHKDNE